MSPTKQQEAPTRGEHPESSGSAANAESESEMGNRQPPRWVAYLLLLRARFKQVILAGVVGGAIVASLLLVAMIPGGDSLLPFLRERYVAQSSLILDLTSSRLAASAAIEEENERSAGMPEVSVPTLESLLTQPQVAHHVLEFVRAYRANRIPPLPAVLDSTVLASLTIEQRILRKMPAGDLELLRKMSLEDFLETPVEQIIEAVKITPKIDKKLAFDVVFSPLIFIEAQADSAELSRLLANLWAVTFEVFYDQSIARKQLLQNKKYIEQQYSEVQSDWTLSQAELARSNSRVSLALDGKTTATFTLPVLEGMLDEQQLALNTLNQELLASESEMIQKEKQLADIRARINVLTGPDGGWIGRSEILSIDGTAAEGSSDETTSGTRFFSSLVPPVFDRVKVESTLERLEVEEGRIDLYQQLFDVTGTAKLQFEVSTERLKHFEEESQLEELEQRKIDSVARVNEYSRRLRSLEIDLKAAEQAKAGLEIQLDSISRTIPLIESLPPEFLLIGRLVQDSATDPEKSPANLAGIKLTREILNPSWEMVDAKFQELTSQIARLAPEVDETRAALTAAELEVRNQQKSLSRLRLQKKLLSQDADAAEAVYRDIQKEYMSLRTRRINLASEVMALHLRIDRLRTRIAELQDTMDRVYEAILGAKSRVTQLTSRLSIQQTTVERLRERVLSLTAQVAENSQQVSVATLALTPQERVWPRRSLLVVLGGLLSALIYAGFMVVGLEMRGRY